MFLLGKKFPAPVAKPMAPFYVAGTTRNSPKNLPSIREKADLKFTTANAKFLLGLVVLYGINSFADVMINSNEFKNDPRNPNAKNIKAAEK